MNQQLQIPELMSYGQIARYIGQGVRNIRKRKKFSRSVLAKKSGISVPTISRLELHGVCSLEALIKISIALDSVALLMNAFSTNQFNSMEEYLAAHKFEGGQ